MPMGKFQNGRFQMGTAFQAATACRTLLQVIRISSCRIAHFLNLNPMRKPARFSCMPNLVPAQKILERRLQWC